MSRQFLTMKKSGSTELFSRFGGCGGLVSCKTPAPMLYCCQGSPRWRSSSSFELLMEEKNIFLLMMIKSHFMASQTRKFLYLRNWIVSVSVWTPVYLLLFICPLNSVSSNLPSPFYDTDLQNDTNDIMLDRLNNNTIPCQSNPVSKSLT